MNWSTDRYKLLFIKFITSTLQIKCRNKVAMPDNNDAETKS